MTTRRKASLTTTVGRHVSRACGCTRPVRDAYLCRECTKKLGDLLDRVPQLAADAAITYSKRARMTVQVGGSRGAETPLPFDPRPR